jgi:hypothetical protein
LSTRTSSSSRSIQRFSSGVRRLGDEAGSAEAPEDRRGLAVFAVEYDEIPTYCALPWRTAVSSARMASVSAVSGPNRCE